MYKEKEELWHKKFDKMSKIIGPILILIGVVQLVIGLFEVVPYLK